MLDGFAFTFKMYGTRFMSLTFLIVVCVCVFFYRFFFFVLLLLLLIFCVLFMLSFGVFVYNGPYVDILLSDSNAMLVLICVLFSFIFHMFSSFFHSFYTKDVSHILMKKTKQKPKHFGSWSNFLNDMNCFIKVLGLAVFKTYVQIIGKEDKA